jgi:hypothetical protein
MIADPVQLLDRLEPHWGWSEPVDLDVDPIAAEILELVFANIDNVVSLAPARRRRRAVAGTAIVTGGAVAAVWNRSPQRTQRVASRSDPANPPVETVGVTWDGITDPTALCSAEWASGSFETAGPPDELTACVTTDGVAAVIPGDTGVCDALGFAEFVPPVDDGLVPAVSDAAAELDRIFFASTNCVPLADAEGEIRRVLDEYGLSGWDIETVGTFSPDEPCATVSLDPASATAVVAPAPRPD